MIFNKKNAFTLAEVLIVLAIIGIVAAITIPELIQSTNDLELKTAWKKEYSTIAQASLRITADNGGDMSNLFSNVQEMISAYAGYLSISKSCNTGDYSCFTEDSIIKNNDGSLVSASCDYSNTMLDDGGFILNDGTEVAFENPSGASIYDRYAFIDVNGKKPPNVIGKDIFGIRLLANKVIPVGSTNSVIHPSISCFVSNSTGMDNSFKYLNQ